MRRSIKPRIKLHSVLLLDDIDCYVRKYDLRGKELRQAASDVLDGAVFSWEVEDLIRRRLLRVVGYGFCKGRDPGGWDPGEEYTLYLTERAVTAFWPHRALDAAVVVTARPAKRRARR